MLIECQLDFDTDFLSDDFFNRLEKFFSCQGNRKVSFTDYYENLVEIYFDLEIESPFCFYIQKCERAISPFSVECSTFEELKLELKNYYGNICGEDEETNF